MSGDGQISADDIVDMVDDISDVDVDTDIEEEVVEQPTAVEEEAVVVEEEVAVEPKNLVKLLDGDKEVTIPREAKIDVKINGKIEQMALQDVINKASGAINVDRENANLGRERKTFKQEQDKFHADAAKINANVSAILNTDDPLEMAQYAADLYGKDPEEVYEKILTSAYDHLKSLQEMTPRERELQKQNRAFMRQQKFREMEERGRAERSQLEGKKAETLRMLEEEGFTLNDFNDGIKELQDKLEKGEPIGFGLDEIKEITESVIIDYLLVKDTNTRVVTALGAENKEMASDEDFTDKVVGAVLKTEGLSGKMTDAEISQFVKQALQIEGKAVKESLNRRVQQSTNSKNITSKTENEEEGFGSLEELYESLDGF